MKKKGLFMHGVVLAVVIVLATACAYEWEGWVYHGETAPFLAGTIRKMYYPNNGSRGPIEFFADGRTSYAGYTYSLDGNSFRMVSPSGHVLYRGTLDNAKQTITGEYEVDDDGSNRFIPFSIDVSEDRLVLLAQNHKFDEVASALASGDYKDIDVKTNDGWTMLMYAAQAGNLNMVKLLIAKKAKVNLRTGGVGASAASLAYDKGEIETYNYLKANGAIDFTPLQVQASPTPQASQASSSSGSAQPASQAHAVTVWYEVSGNRISQIMSITASSKGQAEREAERQWKSINGWNTNAKFLEAVANF
jgi:hypothetical protein